MDAILLPLSRWQAGDGMDIDEEQVRKIIRERGRAALWIGVAFGVVLGAIAGYAIGVYVATDNVTVIGFDDEDKA